MIERINVANLPTPKGHYVHAVRHNQTLYISGQLPVADDGSHETGASFEDQSRQVLRNMLAVLEGAGSGPEMLLKVTVYLVNVDHWPTFDAIFAEMLGEVRPARAVVPVPALHYGYLLEVEAIAAG
ncbi:RidA family protein [Sphingopyxis sp. 2PD]|uniref:RidA family protein n=1 Tax=Sphingopyxis sp. 2PD TaxID=2502196 RepID=UPI0010F6B59C|nr:RidA family protein [Sphingopyxis sp. 2PD]